MKATESKQLLRRKLDTDASNSEDSDLSLLSSRVEELPLAIVQAAAFIREASISVMKYLQMMETSDQHLIDLLSEGFETAGASSMASRRVAETWIVSFEQIQEHHKLAGELLSLMSLFDRQAIPQEFLSSYAERQQNQELSSGNVQMVKAHWGYCIFFHHRG